MTGTWINAAAIILGGSLGVLMGSKLSERIKSTLLGALGLFVIALGVQMFLKTSNSLITLGALVIGGLLGEWLRIEEGVTRLGGWLESKFAHNNESNDREKFIRGFLTASVLFCAGPVAILGSIQDGALGNPQLLIIKSILDGIFAMSFASTVGVGVIFSAFPVFVYQAILTLLGAQLQQLINDAMMQELTAAGGVVLMAVGACSILNLFKLRVGSLIPTLLIAPLLVWLAQLLGWM
jgi:uncharacterized membrane protein YqgA involved in biofilm formation